MIISARDSASLGIQQDLYSRSHDNNILIIRDNQVFKSETYV